MYKSLLHPIARSMILDRAWPNHRMSDFILRQFADPGNQYQSIYEAKMTESLQYINLRKYVKKFAALYCGNMLAMLQLAKEEHVPLLVISYHQLKV